MNMRPSTKRVKRVVLSTVLFYPRPQSCFLLSDGVDCSSIARIIETPLIEPPGTPVVVV